MGKNNTSHSTGVQITGRMLTISSFVDMTLSTFAMVLIIQGAMLITSSQRFASGTWGSLLKL